MNDFPMHVPTYYGHAHGTDLPHGCMPEYGDPCIPVLVREADGIRIVLGSHDYEDTSVPDVQIERRPKGWAIFLHPLPGSDPSGYVYFHDDGRSFVVPEKAWGPTNVIAEAKHEECVEEIDCCDEWKLVDSEPELTMSHDQITIDAKLTFRRQPS